MGGNPGYARHAHVVAGSVRITNGEGQRVDRTAQRILEVARSVLSLAFICIPFIPVVNRIPRWIPIYRLIWLEHYAAGDSGGTGTSS